MRFGWILLVFIYGTSALACGPKLARVAKLYRPLFSTNVDGLKGTKINTTFPANNIAAVTPERWLAPDAELGEQTGLRWKLYLQRPNDVFKVKRGYSERVLKVSQELLMEMATHFVKDFPNEYRREGDEVVIIPTGRRINLKSDSFHPLVKAGILGQDDITLTLPDETGKPIMVAGFLATPTRWSLDDFLGMSPHEIHGPVVPDYGKIRPAVDGAMHGKMRGILQRNNWFIETNPELSRPPYHRSRFQSPEITPGNAMDNLFLRSELESIKPLSDGIAFTIRPRVWSLRWIKENAPEKANDLAAGIEAGYDWADWAPYVVSYLRGTAPAGGASGPSGSVLPTANPMN